MLAVKTFAFYIATSFMEMYFFFNNLTKIRFYNYIKFHIKNVIKYIFEKKVSG